MELHYAWVTEGQTEVTSLGEFATGSMLSVEANGVAWIYGPRDQKVPAIYLLEALGVCTKLNTMAQFAKGLNAVPLRESFRTVTMEFGVLAPVMIFPKYS